MFKHLSRSIVFGFGATLGREAAKNALEWAEGQLPGGEDEPEEAVEPDARGRLLEKRRLERERESRAAAELERLKKKLGR